MASPTPFKFWQRRGFKVAVFMSAAVVLLGWLMYVPEGLLGKADAIGYAVCHRIDLRSFQLGDRQISLCARCTGMYLGAVLGLLYLQLRSPRRGGGSPRRVNALLALLTLIWAGDGLNSFTNLIPGIPSLYTTTNTIRIFAGTGFGIVMAVVVFPSFNQTVWANWDPRPAVGGLREMLPLLGLGTLTALLVLSGNPLLLYPASLISAGGVLLLLTMIYSMLSMVLLQKENFALRSIDLVTPMVLGLTIALVQIAGSDLLRFWVTGTWEGFHFG